MYTYMHVESFSPSQDSANDEVFIIGRPDIHAYAGQELFSQSKLYPILKMRYSSSACTCVSSGQTLRSRTVAGCI